MANNEMYQLGAQSSIIRELFSYGQQQAAVVVLKMSLISVLAILRFLHLHVSRRPLQISYRRDLLLLSMGIQLLPVTLSSERDWLLI